MGRMHVTRDSVSDGFETVVDLAGLFGVSAPFFDQLVDCELDRELDYYTVDLGLEFPEQDAKIFDCEYGRMFADFCRDLYRSLPEVAGAEWLELDGESVELCDVAGFGVSFIPVRVRVDWGALFREWADGNEIMTIDDGRSGDGFYRTCSDGRWVVQTALCNIIERECACEDWLHELVREIDVVQYFPNLLAWGDSAYEASA